MVYKIQYLPYVPHICTLIAENGMTCVAWIVCGVDGVTCAAWIVCGVDGVTCAALMA